MSNAHVNCQFAVIKFPVFLNFVFRIQAWPIFPSHFQCHTIWAIQVTSGHLPASVSIQHSFQLPTTCCIQTLFPTTKYPTFTRSCSTWVWIVCSMVTAPQATQHHRKTYRSILQPRLDPTVHSQALLRVPAKKWSSKFNQPCKPTSNLFSIN